MKQRKIVDGSLGPLKQQWGGINGWTGAKQDKTVTLTQSSNIRLARQKQQKQKSNAQ